MPSGEEEVCRLPTKFRKLIWIKRGDYLIVSQAQGEFSTASGERGAVRYAIVHVLYPDQVKHLRSVGKWPPEFDGPSTAAPDDAGEKLPSAAAAASGAAAEGASAGGAAAPPSAPGAARGDEGGDGSEGEGSAYYSSDAGDDADLFVNNNRRGAVESDEEDE
jgi:probable RNA-binding protein EIF1AD